MVDASNGEGPTAKRARPSSVDDVILAQEAPAAKVPSRPGHKGMMMTLAEVRKTVLWVTLMAELMFSPYAWVHKPPMHTVLILNRAMHMLDAWREPPNSLPCTCRSRRTS